MFLVAAVSRVASAMWWNPITPVCPARARLGVMFLGEDLLAWLVLALGGALFVGNLAAVVRPPERRQADTDLERAPLARSIVMAAVGFVAAVWALGSLVIG
jgi:hypothetical protein